MQEEEVEMITVDTYLEENKISHIDFIKLDVDGFEGKIIRGATKTFFQMQPCS